MSHEYHFSQKRPERAHAVVIGEVEQNVGKAGEIREQKQQTPARRQIRIFDLAPAHAPDDIDQPNRHRLHQQKSEK